MNNAEKNKEQSNLLENTIVFASLTFLMFIMTETNEPIALNQTYVARMQFSFYLTHFAFCRSDVLAH